MLERTSFLHNPRVFLLGFFRAFFYRRPLHDRYTAVTPQIHSSTRYSGILGERQLLTITLPPTSGTPLFVRSSTDPIHPSGAAAKSTAIDLSFVLREAMLGHACKSILPFPHDAAVVRIVSGSFRAFQRRCHTHTPSCTVQRRGVECCIM